MPDETSITLCNRQPFRSGDGCDRGNVDIHQFDDLPFCDSMDPTEASIPPEVLDTPLLLPVPPPCACFSIEHKFKFNYNKENKFVASASFAAKSDCCAGQYLENFNLEMPCPIADDTPGHGKKKKKIKIKLGYSDRGKSESRSYMDVDEDSCAILARNVDFNLNLPCPVRSSTNPKIKAQVQYGTAKTVSAEFMEQDKEDCTVHGKDATLNLTVPCPVQSSANPKIKAKVEYGEAATASEEFMEQNKDNCTVKGKDVNLNLKIPCPVKATASNTITAKVGFGIAESVAQSFLTTDSAKCEIQGHNVTLDLKIPCPVSKERLVIETSCTTESVDEGSLWLAKDSSGSDCVRRIRLKAKFPKGGGGEMELDQKSIDKNSSQKVEIKGWGTGTVTTPAVGEILTGGGNAGDSSDLMICRRQDGALAFRKIGSAGVGAVCFTPVFYNGNLVRTQSDGAWQIGRAVTVGQSWSGSASSGYLCVKFSHSASASTITAQAEVVSTIQPPSDDVTYIPVYHFANGKIDAYFGMPVLPVYDAY